jgi:hypothetical protein
MSSEKHFSLPERQKYFPASSPLAIVDTSWGMATIRDKLGHVATTV